LTKIVWTKDYNVLPSKTNSLHIPKVTKKKAGTYWCHTEKEIEVKAKSDLIVAGNGIQLEVAG